MAGGNSDEGNNYLESVEIYDHVNHSWHSGKTNFHQQKCTAISTKKIPKIDMEENRIQPDFFSFCITDGSLPFYLVVSAMAESPDGRGVLLFGGHSPQNDKEDRILEWRAGANSWTILNITLKNRRREHNVIPLQ